MCFTHFYEKLTGKSKESLALRKPEKKEQLKGLYTPGMLILLFVHTRNIYYNEL